MMLIKKECQKAYEELCKALITTDYVECHKVYTYQKYEQELGIFYKLIKEHFLNPPLKYEEIEEGKWYWHNNKKEWVKILNKDVCTSVSPVIETIHEYINFERNCLYRKQVKE